CLCADPTRPGGVDRFQLRLCPGQRQLRAWRPLRPIWLGLEPVRHSQRTLDTALADADPVPAGGGADCRAALRHPHRLSNCPPEQQRSSPGIPSHVTGQRIYDGDNLRVFAIIHRLEAHAARADCPDYHLAHSRGTTCGDPELSALVATCTLTDARNRHHCGYTRSGWLP